MSISEASKKQGGLAGVIAGESAICTCGTGNGLNYYGYAIEDLAEHESNCQFKNKKEVDTSFKLDELSAKKDKFKLNFISCSAKNLIKSLNILTVFPQISTLYRTLSDFPFSYANHPIKLPSPSKYPLIKCLIKLFGIVGICNSE